MAGKAARNLNLFNINFKFTDMNRSAYWQQLLISLQPSYLQMY